MINSTIRGGNRSLSETSVTLVRCVIRVQASQDFSVLREEIPDLSVLAGMTIPEQLRATTRPLTVTQAAAKLGMHPQTLYRWTRTGSMPVMRIGGALRIDPHTLAQWVEDRSLDG